MYGLTGRTAIVTGGAGGIGRAVALRLAKEGCDVGVFDLGAESAARVAAEVEAAGGRAASASGDVSDRTSVDAGMASLTDVLGTPDILVNSAGILRVGKMLEQSYEDFNAQFRVNVDGTFHVCQSVVPAMVVNGRGAVVNMASWLGKHGMGYYSGYCATKFAVIGMTQTLALELASTGVRVNCVCPGPIADTKMRDDAEEIHRRIGFPSAEERTASIPLGRLGTPEDVARVTCFLASDEADYMTGQAVNVTGGLWLH